MRPDMVADPMLRMPRPETAALSKLCADGGRGDEGRDGREQDLTHHDYSPFAGLLGLAGSFGALALGFALVRRIGRRPGLLGRRSRGPRLGKDTVADGTVGRAVRDDGALALSGLTLLPAFDRHREVNAGDLLIIAKLGFGRLRRTAQPARLVHLDLEIGVRIEPIDELVAVLLGDLHLIGEGSVEILAAEVSEATAVRLGGEQRSFNQGAVGH